MIRVPERADNARGGMWLLLSALCFTAEASLIKIAGRGYPTEMQLVMRQLGGLVALFPFFAANPRGAFAVKRPLLMVFRSVVGTLGLVLSIFAIQHLTLSDATALSFTRTLWIPILAAMVLKEPLRIKPVVASILGFVAVVLMLRPTLSFGSGELAGFGAALLFAATIVAVKLLTRTEVRIAIMMHAATLGLCFALILAIPVWQMPNPADALLLLSVGVVGAATQATYVRGLELGDAAVVAPVDYMRLVFALLVGFVCFDESPTLSSCLGILIIVASTYALVIGGRARRATPTGRI